MAQERSSGSEDEGYKAGDVVRPLFFRRDGHWRFAGTGFFFHHQDSKYLATAHHVLQGDCMGVMMPLHGEGPFRADEILKEATLVAHAPKPYDLAVLKVSDGVPGVVPQLASEPPYLNYSVYTYEYARFEMAGRDGKRIINPNASYRRGNIVRYVMQDPYFPDGSLELSYPAIAGASGAPVFLSDPWGFKDYGIVGVITTNAKYDLLPIEDHFFKDADGSEERRRYYLPAAIAIHVSHLKKLVESISARK
ncbi:MAG: serine protease [Amphiplicatus sp.]